MSLVYGDIDEYESFIQSVKLPLDWNQKRKVLTRLSSVKDSHKKGSLTESLSREFKKVKAELPFYDILASQFNSKDYRLLENRDEMILKNFTTRMLSGDLDHWHGAHIGADYFSLDPDQKCWHALLFGYSYRTQWANIAIQIWPTYKGVREEHVREWSNLGNYNIIPVGKDCRWNKFKFPEFFKGVQDFAGNDTLYEKLYKAAHVSNDPNENFVSLQNAISSIPRFGRMTTFLAMQHLYEFFDWPISGHEMMLGNSNTWSCRIGTYMLMSDMTKMSEQEIMELGKVTPKGEGLQLLEQFTDRTIKMMDNNLPFKPDVFNLESEKCETYDKYFLKSREFNFWTSIELSELVEEVITDWEEKYQPTDAFPIIPDLTPLLITQFTKRPREMGGAWHDPNWHLTANQLGVMVNYHYYFDDEPNVYDHLPIAKLGEIKRPEIIKRWDSVSTYNRQEWETKYDPRLFLRWKKNFNKDSVVWKNLKQSEKDYILYEVPKLAKEGKIYHEYK